MANYIVTTRRPVPDVRAKFEAEDRAVDKMQGLFATLEDRDAAAEELKSIPGIVVTGALDKNIAVSYTHLDVYKRQRWKILKATRLCGKAQAQA